MIRVVVGLFFWQHLFLQQTSSGANYSEAGRHARDRSWPALPSTDICYGQPHGGRLWEATSETTSNCCWSQYTQLSLLSFLAITLTTVSNGQAATYKDVTDPSFVALSQSTRAPLGERKTFPPPLSGSVDGVRELDLFPVSSQAALPDQPNHW